MMEKLLKWYIMDISVYETRRWWKENEETQEITVEGDQ
jgi:hypothetical protein